MDDLDLRIVRAIGMEPFTGALRTPHPWRPEALAEALGESARLVKDRVARLEREGLVEGYEAQPSLSLLGLSSRTYAFSYATRADRRATLERVTSLPGVLGYVDYVTSWLTVTIAYADDAERDLRLADVCATLGVETPLTWFEPAPQRADRELSRLDWRIVQQLRRDARRSAREVAEALGLTAKTVQRRLDRLTADGALSVHARLGDRLHDHVLLCSLVLRLDANHAAHAMMALHGDLLSDAWARCSASMPQEGVHYDLVAAPRSPRGLADLLEAAAKLPGVTHVEGHLAARARWTLAWLDARIEEKVAA